MPILISVLTAALVLSPSSAPARPLRLAVVPFENQTGHTSFDYLSDLAFNLIVSQLKEYEGVALFERQRSDLILKERSLSPEDIYSLKPSVPVDAILSGAFRQEGQTGWKIVRLSIRWLNQIGEAEDVYEQEVDLFAIDVLIPTLKRMVSGKIIAPNKMTMKKGEGEEETIPGVSVAVIGFNNYSPEKKYDPLQKGIIYLIEERLGRNPDLKVVERDQLKKVIAEHALSNLSREQCMSYDFAAADLIVAGCFAFYDHTFRIDSRIINVHTTEIERAFHHESDINAIPDTVKDSIENIAQCLSGKTRKEEPARDIYPNSQEALLYYARGADLYDQGEYLAAIENINRALSVDPGYIFGQWEVARIYEEYLYMYGKALAAYEKVLESKPGKTIKEKTLLRLGMINYHYLNNYQQAADYFSQFLKEFAGSVYDDVILYSLGHSLQQMGKYTEALEYYNKSLKDTAFSPLRGSLLVRAGQCYYNAGDYATAREYLEKARAECGDAIFQAEKGRREVTIKEEAGKYLDRLK